MSYLSELTVLTLGHSTRSRDEFISVLKAHKINLVVDIRMVPRSRYNPQFNKEPLSAALKIENIQYVHLPELGGFRRPRSDSPNMALQDKSLRGYADYMETKEFTENLLKLIALAKGNHVVVMCTEALPSRCHRSLLSDALTIRGIKVVHILNLNHKFNHELSATAVVEGTKITYPLYVKESPQKTLTDFPAL
ncbi:MAG: DUF488 domain-containing protein [Candidatus Bathyarchaeota archaeon]|nr:DUF488 domain-containing protein [Candidatus Bathyarchaeota archaeon]